MAVDGPFVADIQPGRSVAVRLQPVGYVVECTCVGDVAVGQSAREIGDPVCQGPPRAVVLFWCGVGRRFDGMSLLDERVEIYHLLMVVEEVDDHLPRDV